jgi:hypothetical protein
MSRTYCTLALAIESGRACDQARSLPIHFMGVMAGYLFNVSSQLVNFSDDGVTFTRMLWRLVGVKTLREAACMV